MTYQIIHPAIIKVLGKDKVTKLELVKLNLNKQTFDYYVERGFIKPIKTKVTQNNQQEKLNEPIPEPKNRGVDSDKKGEDIGTKSERTRQH